MGKKIGKDRAGAVYTALMWFFGILMIYPFIMMIAISFRTSGDAYKPLLADVTLTLRNYTRVLGHSNFLDWCLNTVVAVVSTIFLRLVVTVLASYAFSRIKFKGSAVIFAVYLATMMVSTETTMVPRYVYYQSLGLIDSLWAIILPECSEVFYLVLLTEFFRTVPEDFSEAAMIDGAGHIRVLCSIFLPLSGASVATAVLFSFINIWNNFLDPYLFISSIEKQLITPALQYFQQQGGADVPLQLAGSTIALMPVIFLFVFTQKYFVKGVASSGVKG